MVMGKGDVNEEGDRERRSGKKREMDLGMW
jgi:hypothetical protein